jgi:hypothetical protein
MVENTENGLHRFEDCLEKETDMWNTTGGLGGLERVDSILPPLSKIVDEVIGRTRAISGKLAAQPIGKVDEIDPHIMGLAALVASELQRLVGVVEELRAIEAEVDQLRKSIV